MTNETEAPERIWIDPWGGNWSPVAGGTQGVEYTRADLSDKYERGWLEAEGKLSDAIARIAELEADREALEKVLTGRDHVGSGARLLKRAFSRAEAAEAKLAKAVGGLEFIGSDDGPEGRHARATLAELQKPIATRDDPA